MDLTKYFEAQQVLRDRIDYKEADRFNKLIISLIVELCECANEVRFFKFWSHKPASAKEIVLEEFVDCLHFVLELGLELGVTDPKLLYKIDKKKTLEDEFLFVVGCVYGLYQANNSQDAFIKYFYSSLLSHFVKLGEMLGFEWDEVDAAYFAKNKVNHIRQETGY